MNIDNFIEVASWYRPELWYEWDEWHAYYDPSRKVFVVGAGSGCSCNAYDDDCIDLEGITTKRALASDLIRWVYGTEKPDVHSSLYASVRETVSEIKAWKVPK